MKKMPHAIRSTIVARGFTLIELMISIAIALMLMVGVGGVFRVASDTIGVGQAVATISRLDRGLQYTMGEDFKNMAHDGPVLTIHFQNGQAYSSAEDYYANSTLIVGEGGFDPTQIGNMGAQRVTPALYNNWSHRMDSISFFVRGNYTRKAIASGFVDTSAQSSSAEAWVWYGLLSLADNNPLVNYNTKPTYWWPASFYGSGNEGAYTPTDNVNNDFAINWVLGRVAILLRPDANLDAANGYIPANPSGATPVSPASPLSPLAADSPVILPPIAPYNGPPPIQQFGSATLTASLNTGTWTIESGAVDLAQTSINNFRDLVTSQIEGRLTWWAYMEGYPPAAIPGTTAPKAGRFFHAYSWMPKPINAAANAQMAFNLASGCSQFIVEYAGDFLNQNPATGAVINTYNNINSTSGLPPTDGQIDYILDTNPDGSTTKRIRWYGMARDVAPGGGGTTLPPPQPAAGTVFAPDGIIPSDGTTSAVTTLQPMYIPDVVPLKDLWLQCPGNTSNSGPAPFEVKESQTQQTGIPANYAATPGSPLNRLDAGDAICVWGPQDRKPRLIRITMVFFDPNRRMHDGRSMEYIFSVN